MASNFVHSQTPPELPSSYIDCKLSSNDAFPIGATTPEHGQVQVFDIRRSHGDISLANDIRQGLNPAPGYEKTLPTLLLYNEAGLKLFEDITFLEDYYLTNTEIEILEINARTIAQSIKPGSVLIELGSGYYLLQC